MDPAQVPLSFSGSISLAEDGGGADQEETGSSIQLNSSLPCSSDGGLPVDWKSFSRKALPGVA